MSETNPNWTWASTLVDELQRCGVTDAVIAPGSRSTPMVLAFARTGGFRIHSLLDERGAAFFALGLGLASGRPAAVLCTSGTAAANFLPAVVEAGQAGVPLIVLTADRPPELRDTGANQTIDQVGMYGPHVRFAVDVPAPQAGGAALILRYLRTTVDRAVAAALGPVPGPVHLNLPFRKPLEPGIDEVPAPAMISRAGPEPFTRIDRRAPEIELPRIDWPPRGLIMAGPRCPGGDFPEAVSGLSRLLGYPIVADGLSGLRFGPWTAQTAVLNPQVCAAIGTDRGGRPGLLLQFGGVPTSSAALEMLARMGDGVPRVSVQPDGTWRDDVHGLSHLVHADPASFCQALAAALPGRGGDDEWIAALAAADRAYRVAVEHAAADTEFEGLVLQDTVDALPDGGTLFVANSLPVRHLDEFVMPVEKRLRVLCNRGASGIDGTISTAFGAAAASDAPLVLVIGDLAFYHDLNGLLAAERLGLRATIVLVHNDGGGVFRRLPVAAHSAEFDPYFLTPHSLDFEPAVRMFGLEFERAGSRADLREALQLSIGSDRARVIEVRTDSQEHEQIRQRIMAKLGSGDAPIDPR